MLRDVFPFLLGEGEFIESATIWEASRICAVAANDPPQRGKNGLSLALGDLLAGIGEVAIIAGLTQIVAVFDERFYRITKAAGCAPQIIGAPAPNRPHDELRRTLRHRRRPPAGGPQAARNQGLGSRPGCARARFRTDWRPRATNGRKRTISTGTKIAENVVAFARETGISAASLTAIGAFKQATVGWLDFVSKTYKEIAVNEQCEVLSPIGDIAVGDDNTASVHVHVVLGLSEGSTRGGHLLKGTVHPTLEVVLTPTPAKLRRRMRPSFGIALIDADLVSGTRDR